MDKTYLNIDTGETYTLEELKGLYKDYQCEMAFDSFEGFMETSLMLGREKIGGLVEIEQ